MTIQAMKFLTRALLLCLALLGSAAVLASEKITYFHNEPTGSAAMATDAAGAVVWKETYRPFGDRLVRAAGAADNSLWYAGRHQEEGIGLSYLGARYYDAALGRFVSVDAAEVNPEDLHSFNRYAYANNNPYRYVDPDGNTPFDIAFLVYDIGKLGIAAYSGVGVGAAATDVGISALSLFSPVPGAGQALKAARVADKAVDTAQAAKNADRTIGVYRVFGGDARAQGYSWTTRDPRTVENFRDAAGLPSGGASGSINTADYLIKGKVRAADVIKFKSAEPLDGNKGGIRELIIDPKKVRITSFSVLNQ